MTDLLTPAATEAAAASGRTSIPRGLFRFAGIALIAFPVLFTAGMVFSPPQTEEGEAGYILSLAADPTVSVLSASFLHYAWVALALGVVGLIGLVAGRRSRAWVAVASVVGGRLQIKAGPDRRGRGAIVRPIGAGFDAEGRQRCVPHR